METPDREHVRRVASADHHNVLPADKSVDVVDRAVEQQKMRRLALDPRERLIEGQEVRSIVA